MVSKQKNKAKPDHQLCSTHASVQIGLDCTRDWEERVYVVKPGTGKDRGYAVKQGQGRREGQECTMNLIYLHQLISLL